jgi:hypothetical protein
MRALRQVVLSRQVVDRARQRARSVEGGAGAGVVELPVVDLGKRVRRRRDWRSGRVASAWR